MVNMEIRLREKNDELEEIMNLFDENWYILDDYDEFVAIDGMAGACVGFSEDARLIYDYDKMVEIIMEKWGLSQEEAVDYVDYNIVSMCSGEKMPIVMNTFYRDK